MQPIETNWSQPQQLQRRGVLSGLRFDFFFAFDWIEFSFSFFFCSWMFSRSLFSLLRIYQTSSKCFTKLTPQTIANTTAFLTFVSLLQEFLASLWLQRLLGKLRCVLQTLRGHDLVRSGWGLVGRCQRQDVRCFCQFYWKLVNLFVIALLLYYYFFFFISGDIWEQKKVRRLHWSRTYHDPETFQLSKRLIKFITGRMLKAILAWSWLRKGLLWSWFDMLRIKPGCC